MTMPTRKRHIPQRTCVACRRVRAKRDLVRVVRGLDGCVRVDITGRSAGRGAYLCRTAACWEQALKRSSLEHALNSSLTAEDRAALAAYVLTLPAAEPEPPLPDGESSVE
ncbi:MAG: YlxR family protein [Chloroflexi bacterium]|nr:YlxR family protein [Chloroflexota bacterium]MBU1879169.1 YlxR family protein [Chloroflexota bacterium]